MTDDDINEIIKSSNEEEDLKAVDNYVVELMKRFDTVQIFCTRYKGGDGNTVSVNKGNGNWWARYGQVRMWIETSNAEETSRYYKGE